jgi:hypothetical protein
VVLLSSSSCLPAQATSLYVATPFQVTAPRGLPAFFSFLCLFRCFELRCAVAYVFAIFSPPGSCPLFSLWGRLRRLDRLHSAYSSSWWRTYRTQGEPPLSLSLPPPLFSPSSISSRQPSASLYTSRRFQYCREITDIRRSLVFVPHLDPHHSECVRFLLRPSVV